MTAAVLVFRLGCWGGVLCAIILGMRTHLVCLALSLSVVLAPAPALAAVSLVKSAGNPTVYYLDGGGVRHAFPNDVTFRSWYAATTAVATLSDDFLATLPLGRNVTLRPGRWLAKVPSAPAVYAVEAGGLLREIENEDVARAIYGAAWSRRVVDVPEVFFNDYTVGEPLERDYELPDDTIYQTRGQPGYYWKSNRMLRPFADAAALASNGYRPEDAVVGSRALLTRRRPITGADPTLPTPADRPRLRQTDCAVERLRVAFVLVTGATPERELVARVEALRSELPARWDTATLGLSVVDAGYPVVSLRDDAGYLRERGDDGVWRFTNEVPLTFYDSHPDEFDFLVLLTDVRVLKHEEQATFTPVTNSVAGIGQPLLDASDVFGSRGKLKGIVSLGNARELDTASAAGRAAAMNLLLHELGHQWSGTVRFSPAQGPPSDALLRPPDRLHWSHYVTWRSPLGGLGWRDNGNGTFTNTARLREDEVRAFAPLDLYLMGLLPTPAVGELRYVVPAVAGQVGDEIAGTSTPVTMAQIIAANGKRRCEP